MLRTLWRALGRPALCGAVVLTAVGLGQAQGLPQIPQPPLAPAPVVEAPKIPEVRLPNSSGLGAPIDAPIKTAAPAPVSNPDDKARIERLESQIQELTNAVKAAQVSQPAPVASETPASQQTLTTKDVQQLINGYMAEKEAQKKAE